MSCVHDSFESHCDVFRHPDTGTWSMDIRVKCITCGQPFRFRGVPMGVLKDGPAMSVDGKELRVPIYPAIAPPLPGEDVYKPHWQSCPECGVQYGPGVGMFEEHKKVCAGARPVPDLPPLPEGFTEPAPPSFEQADKETTNGKPPEPGFENRGAPAPIDETTGQHKAYWVLSEAERAKGFVRPVRNTYTHIKCGVATTMGQAIAETYARNPKFYGATFCCGCSRHFPVAEFKWDDGSILGS